MILLLSIVLRLSDAGADGFEDLSRVVEKLVERRMQGEREKWAMGMKELEAKMEKIKKWRQKLKRWRLGLQNWKTD